MNKTDFFQKHGHQLVKVNNDDAETGDYQLFAPEESNRANEYMKAGYMIASIYEDTDGTERVALDNDAGTSFHKIGYLVLTNKI
jgi:hypothetical protein